MRRALGCVLGLAVATVVAVSVLAVGPFLLPRIPEAVAVVAREIDQVASEVRHLASQARPAPRGASGDHQRSHARAKATVAQLRAVAAADISGLVEVDANHHYLYDELCTAWPVGSGYFLTDYHCVYGTAQAPGFLGRLLGEGVALTPLDTNDSVAGGSFDAVVVDVDPSHDLALLRVEGPNLADWPALARGLPLDLNPVRVGEPTVTLDFHAINQRPFATYGYVDQTSVNLSPDPAANAYPGEPDDYTDVVEIGGTVYPGNSGGPVLNAKGQVVGIVVLGGKGFSTFEATPMTLVGPEVERWLGR